MSEPESDEVGFRECCAVAGEQQPGWPVEFDVGFGDSAGHAFAGPDVEGRTHPSPGLDREPEGNERLRRRILSDDSGQLRGGAEFVGCGGAVAQEFQNGGDHLEQHVGAHLNGATLILGGL